MPDQSEPTRDEATDLIGKPTKRPIWIPLDDFVQNTLPNRADPGLIDELRELAPDTTDELQL